MAPARQQNPWLRIPASDYEGHMGPEGADQLSVLSRLFREAYVHVRPARVAVLGCATGNGLEHIAPEITRKVVGIDVNPAYLEVARRRFPALHGSLELVCSSLEDTSLKPASFELISAGLIFEYVDPGPLLRKIAAWLTPGGICAVVLQLPSEGCPEVLPTGYETLGALEDVMRLVRPQVFESLARRAGLIPTAQRTAALRYGKRFFSGWFAKPRT
jgi:SAM-dependent methyltransferase